MTSGSATILLVSTNTKLLAISDSLYRVFTHACTKPQKLDNSHSPQVPPPRQCYSPGSVTIFGFAAVPLMLPLTQW